jgi:hypothetical protein
MIGRCKAETLGCGRSYYNPSQPISGVTQCNQEANVMVRKACFAFAAIGLMVAARPLTAHHAFSAEFDAKRPVKLRGVVTKMEWINPHSWIHVDVKDASGKVTEWMVEGGAPNALLRRGFTKKSLPIGTEVFIEGYQAKDGSNRANGRDLTLPDGQKLFVGSSGTGAPLDGRDTTEPKK